MRMHFVVYVDIRSVISHVGWKIALRRNYLQLLYKHFVFEVVFIRCVAVGLSWSVVLQLKYVGIFYLSWFVMRKLRAGTTSAHDLF